MALGLWAVMIPEMARATEPVPALTKGPYFINVASDEARVVVETATPETLTLTLMDEAEGVLREESFETRAWRRDGRALGSRNLRGLTPNTRYRVRIRGSRGQAQGSFWTAPADDSDAPFSFLVYGDNRTQHDEHRAVVRPMLEEEDVRFLLHTGDMVEMGGRVRDWDTYFDIAGGMLQDLPIFPTLGNHELYGPGGGIIYLRHLTAPGTRVAYYDRRYGPVRILSLDSNDHWGERSAQFEWLRSRLAEPSDARFTFLILHHSPVSSGPHGGHEAMRESGMMALLADSSVDLVMAGHDHMYERGEEDGVKYIIAGGGGAPLYRQNRANPAQLAFMPTYHYLRVDLEGETVTVTAKAPDGEVLEQCAFEHGTPFRCADGTPAGPIWEGETMEDPRPFWRTWGAVAFAVLGAGGLLLLWRSRKRRRR